MSEDFSRAMKQLTDMLSQESLPDNLKGLLSLLGNPPGNKEEPPPKPQQEAAAKREEKSTRSELEDNIEMIRKMRNVMQRINNTNDPRINLLTAIRPFMNAKRQSTLSNCIKLLHVTNLTRYIDQHEE